MSWCSLFVDITLAAMATSLLSWISHYSAAIVPASPSHQVGYTTSPHPPAIATKYLKWTLESAWFSVQRPTFGGWNPKVDTHRNLHPEIHRYIPIYEAQFYEIFWATEDVRAIAIVFVFLSCFFGVSILHFFLCFFCLFFACFVCCCFSLVCLVL